MSLLIKIDVPDAEIAMRFYTSAFGLKVGRRFGKDFIELLGWEAPVYLLTKNSGTVGAGSDLRRYERHWTPVHLDLHVADFDGVLAAVRAAGGTIENEFRTEGPMPAAFCSDPFGNGFCVIGEV